VEKESLKDKVKNKEKLVNIMSKFPNGYNCWKLKTLEERLWPNRKFTETSILKSPSDSHIRKKNFHACRAKI
jgi:hypothetical protein